MSSASLCGRRVSLGQEGISEGSESLQQHLPRSSGRESSTEHGHAPWGRGAECTSRNAGLPAIATIITAPVATDVPTTAAPARRTFHQGVPLGSIIAYLPAGRRAHACSALSAYLIEGAGRTCSVSLMCAAGGERGHARAGGRRVSGLGPP